MEKPKKQRIKKKKYYFSGYLDAKYWKVFQEAKDAWGFSDSNVVRILLNYAYNKTDGNISEIIREFRAIEGEEDETE